MFLLPMHIRWAATFASRVNIILEFSLIVKSHCNYNSTCSCNLNINVHSACLCVHVCVWHCQQLLQSICSYEYQHVYTLHIPGYLGLLFWRMCVQFDQLTLLVVWLEETAFRCFASTCRDFRVRVHQMTLNSRLHITHTHIKAAWALLSAPGTVVLPSHFTLIMKPGGLVSRRAGG